MKKNTSLILIVIIIIGAIIFIVFYKNKASEPMIDKSQNGKETQTYQGYLIRNPEAMYFVYNYPLEDNKDSEKFWVKDQNNKEVMSWEKSLVWKPISPNSKSEFVKVTIVGKSHGPGVYGGVPGYKFEIEVHNVNQIFE